MNFLHIFLQVAIGRVHSLGERLAQKLAAQKTNKIHQCLESAAVMIYQKCSYVVLSFASLALVFARALSLSLSICCAL